jgi:hypothetical protein
MNGSKLQEISDLYYDIWFLPDLFVRRPGGFGIRSRTDPPSTGGDTLAFNQTPGVCTAVPKTGQKGKEKQTT